ncbi:MAG TPA: diguanylate cyclase [Solirubrobacteraceae bacterium]|nr:diguanylate cyclase [Solirubrobacteraceae bacterium]
MSALDTHPEQASSAAEEATALEIAINIRLQGFLERAERLRDRARAEGDAHTLARAELLIAEHTGRRGDIDAAIERQRALLERARAGGRATIEGRAQFYLASNWERIGLRTESLEAASDGVRLLDPSCPPHWHVEHHMVLAMLTNYDRAGGTDLELMEDALRRARALGDPDVLLLVLNNFAWTAHQSEEGRPRAYELMEEMIVLVAEGRAVPSAADLDTMGWLRLARGELREAERLLELGLSHSDHVEPDSVAALRIHLAEIRRRQGRFDAATRLLEHGRAQALATKTPEFALEALDVLAAIDAERGDHRRAYRRLRRLLEERARFERSESERRAAVLQSIYATQNERDQRRYYQELAIRDPLTGMYNRRYLEDRLAELIGVGELALAMIDIDHFKRINDEHSHEAGDSILRQLGTILADHARRMSPDGFAVRLGGEEFVIVAPDVSATQAVASLTQLRRSVAVHRWDGVPASVAPTISIGLATCGPGAGDTRATLLARSDELLYRAKRAGRNRVVSDDTAPPVLPPRNAPPRRVPAGPDPVPGMGLTADTHRQAQAIIRT